MDCQTCWCGVPLECHDEIRRICAALPHRPDCLAAALVGVADAEACLTAARPAIAPMLAFSLQPLLLL
jgi:hypothetical protein